jgi:hypothetical protein
MSGYGAPTQPYPYAPSDAQTAFVPVYGLPPVEEPAPVAPPPRSRTGLWLTLIVIVILILSAGGAAAYVFIRMDQSTAVGAGRTTPTTTVSATPTPSPTPTAGSQLSTPDTIGSFHRVTQQSVLDKADQLRTELGSLLPGETDSVAAAYQDPKAPGSPVIVAAASGPVSEPAALVDGIFSDSSVFSHLHAVSAAATQGGSAKCAQANQNGATITACAWADDRTVGFVFFYDRGSSQSDSLFPTFRAAVLRG